MVEDEFDEWWMMIIIIDFIFFDIIAPRVVNEGRGKRAGDMSHVGGFV